MRKTEELITTSVIELKGILLELEESFKNKSKEEIMGTMDMAIPLFIRTIKMMNQIEACKDISSLPYERLRLKPINLEERYTFIQQRRYSYHSCVQLIQLTNELEKQYAIKRISAN